MGSKMTFLSIVFLISILGITAFYLKPHPFDDHIEWLTSNSKFEYNGETYPRLEYYTKEEIQIIAYTQESIDEAQSEDKAIPRIKALYNHRDNVIILEQGTDISDHDSAYIIVHELVHYLQMINGVTAQQDCLAVLEADAYLLQYEWQKAHDHPGPYPNFLFVKALVSSCKS